MDYKEFEQHVVDYVEGALDGEMQRRMDSARASDPACEALAQLHEQILAALEDTPKLEAPAGLTDKIMAGARMQEQLLAAERKAFRRGIRLGVAAAAVGAAALAVLLFTYDMSTGNEWIAGISNTLYGWLGSAEALMQAEVELPVVNRPVPVYVLVFSAAVSGVLAWFRDEIMAVVDSF